MDMIVVEATTPDLGERAAGKAAETATWLETWGAPQIVFAPDGHGGSTLAVGALPAGATPAGPVRG